MGNNNKSSYKTQTSQLLLQIGVAVPEFWSLSKAAYVGWGFQKAP